MDCPIPTEKILHCTRIAKINRENNQRPRSIVVQFATPRDRDTFLAAAIKFNKSKPSPENLNTSHLGYSGEKPVYVLEHLSPSNKALHAAARLAARKSGYKHVWIRHGRIFVRKTDHSDYILIRDMNSLDKIK